MFYCETYCFRGIMQFSSSVILRLIIHLEVFCLQACHLVLQIPQGRIALFSSNREQGKFWSALKYSCSILSLSFLHLLTVDLKCTDINHLLQWFDGTQVTDDFFIVHRFGLIDSWRRCSREKIRSDR